MKDSEKEDLNNSILFDSFTPDFSFENMKGMGTLSGEALKRAMTLGYIKRDNLKETYDILVDREKNLILAIMMNVTHIHLRNQLSKLYSDGIISLDLAVTMLALTDAPQEEIELIKSEKQASSNGNESSELDKQTKNETT